MSQHPGAAPSGGPGWGRLLLALAAFLLLPAFPFVRVVLPVEHASLLLVPALAVCAVVGWWAGGSPWLALLWAGFAIWMLMQRPHAGGSFHDLTRGWSLLAAGAFGLVCVLARTRTFLPRALAAVGIAFGAALLLALRAGVAPSGVTAMVESRLTARSGASLAELHRGLEQLPASWQRAAERYPLLGEWLSMERGMEYYVNAPAIAAPVFPALLALQSLAALALAWALYHRLGRVRIGLPLAPLREFRFNDQLVWGLVAGVAIVLLPTLASLHGAGWNLLVFFGALFALRGMAVMAWFLTPGTVGTVVIVLVTLLVWPLLGLGLGDTWRDWRSRARTLPRSPS